MRTLLPGLPLLVLLLLLLVLVLVLLALVVVLLLAVVLLMLAMVMAFLLVVMVFLLVVMVFLLVVMVFLLVVMVFLLVVMVFLLVVTVFLLVMVLPLRSQGHLRFLVDVRGSQVGCGRLVCGVIPHHRVLLAVVAPAVCCPLHPIQDPGFPAVAPRVQGVEMVLERSVHRPRVRRRIHRVPVQGRILRKVGGGIGDGVFFDEVGGAWGVQRAGYLSRGVEGLHPPNVLLGVCPSSWDGTGPYVHITSFNTVSCVSTTTGLVTTSEYRGRSYFLRFLVLEVAHLGGVLSSGQAIAPSGNVFLSSLILLLPLQLAGI